MNELLLAIKRLSEVIGNSTLTGNYERRTQWGLMDKGGKENLGGCAEYWIYNAGNVNATVNNVYVLRPGQWFASPPGSASIRDMSELNIVFDQSSTPAMVAPDGGSNPTQKTYVAGDPPPERDTRVVIVKGFLTRV